MNDFKVLVTGDYWHSDFKSLLVQSFCSITLRRLESILSDDPAEVGSFRLVIIAMSYRDQFATKQIELLLRRYVNIPVVAVCGSWCEGEMRSGSPVPGLIRVYWHQWAGRSERFFQQLINEKYDQWQMPRIASSEDRILNEYSAFELESSELKIGVSATAQEHFEMVEDALSSCGHQCVWLENCAPNCLPSAGLQIICLEANSLNEITIGRIKNCQTHFRNSRIIVMLNFPRSHDFELAAKLGVDRVVSKPFQLSDLKFAIWHATSACSAA